MRLFWKVFAVLWLATLLVGGSGFLISRALQQDWLLLQFHPQLRDFSSQLVGVYEEQGPAAAQQWRSEEHTSELQSRPHLVCRLLLEKKKKKKKKRKKNNKRKTRTTRENKHKH